MTHERSDSVYFAWQEANAKFDYFLAGVAAALVAYVGEQLEISSLGMNQPTLELASVAVFCAAFYCGVKRIESTTTLQKLNAQRLFDAEASIVKTKAADENRLQMQAGTDLLYTPDALRAMAREHRERVDNVEAKFDEVQKSSYRWYRWRNRLMLGGFAVLVLAKTLPAIISIRP